MYKTRSKSAFFSNAVFYKLSTSSFTSLLFRSNGFKLGGLSANRIFLNQIRFFQFFRNFAFYDLFRRSFNSFFFDRTNVFDNSYSFFLFFKESFFRYFSRYKRINKYSSIFKVSMNQRIKILKNAFMLFFFYRKYFSKNIILKNSIVSFIFSPFYTSESIFFHSHMAFQKSKMRQFFPLITTF